MELNPAPLIATPDSDETRRRLTSEIAEVESAIALVASGSATRITLTGLRFGEAVTSRFQADAGAKGIRIEPLPWPDDAGCDLVVERIDE
jgi:hypothetical protein